MPAVKARNLARQLELDGPRKVHRELKENFDNGQLTAADFSLNDLAEHLIGREFVNACNPQKSGGIDLLEAADAVSTTHFANITGQIAYSEVMAAYEQEELVFTKLIPVKQTKFNGEKIPGFGGIGDRAEIVKEGDAFPLVGISEDWVETPETKKRGMITAITKEAIFFDLTGQLVDNSRAVGQWLAVNREKRAINCVIDENTTAHRHRWRNTVYATYQATTPWINIQASNTLVDWTDLDAAEQLLGNMTDRNTGEPISLSADTIIATPQLAATARYITNAAGITMQVGGFATSGNLSATHSPSPLTGTYNVVSSRQLRAQLATDTSWFYGRPRDAFRYYENWPMKVEQAPPNSYEEWHRDIVTGFKASERGAYFVYEPRLMVKSTVA